MIYHIASRADWESARRTGAYTVSTRGKSLAEVGFIHASYANQVAAVANAFYADADDPVILVIDPARLTSPLRPEPVGNETFPHIYGPLNPDAVIEVREFNRDPSGQFSFDSP